MAFYNVKDGLYKLAIAGSGYTHGSSSTVVLGTGLGASMPATPFLLCLVKASGYGTDSEVMRAFAVTNRSSDTLTLSILGGYADDTDFTTSDYAEVRALSRPIADLNAAVAALQVMSSTGDMIYSSSGSTPARLAMGDAYQQLSAGAGGVPAYLYGCGGVTTINGTSTTLTAASPSIVVIDMTSATGNVTITLPDPATCPGKQFWFNHSTGISYQVNLATPSGTTFMENNTTAYQVDPAGRSKGVCSFISGGGSTWITLVKRILDPAGGGTGSNNGSITIGGVCYGSTIGTMVVTSAGNVGQTIISGGTSGIGWSSGVYTLSTTTGINAFSATSTNLFTVPTGRTAVITDAFVRCSAASSVSGPATAGVGVTGSDVIASTSLLNLTSTTKLFRLAASGSSVPVAAGSVVKFNIDAAATGTSQTLVVDLLGYLL